MSERRRGMGFGNGDRGDPGQRPTYDDFEEDNMDATRAMEAFDDEMPPPTEMVQAPVSGPPPAARPQRRRPMPRGQASVAPAAAPPATLFDDGPAPSGDTEDATRVLSTADLDAFNAATGGDMAPAAPVAPVLLIELHVVSGPDRGKVHTLSEGGALVGRGLDCNIVLADPAVSRKHFRVVRTDDDVDAVDMGGANGTNINGGRITQHRLKPGDQIEVGTTVLEFRVDGAAASRSRNDFPQSGSAASRSDARPSKKKKKSSIGLFIGIAAAGIVVLGGGGFAAWMVMNTSADSVETAAIADPDASDIVSLIKDAKDQLADEDWAEAVDTLKKAKKVSPSNTDVKGLLAKAEEELEASESMEEGRAQHKKKRYKQAIAHFDEVANSSGQYSDAQEAIREAKLEMAGAYLAAARKAMEAADNVKAKALLKLLLKLDPKHTEGKLLAEQLAGDDSGAQNDGGKGKAGAAGGKKDPAAASAAGRAAAPNAAGVFKRGLKAYHNREWSAAKQAFDSIVKGRYSKKDRAKAAKYMGGSADVAAAFGTANTQQSPLKQAKAWRKAYGADKRVDGHFGAMLIKRLTAAYVAAGKQLYKGGRYGRAATAVREAMNYDPENAEAMKLEDQCMSQAAKLLGKAKQQLAKKRYGYAQQLARQVMAVLPSMDPRAAEARAIALKAAEANSAGGDD